MSLCTPETSAIQRLSIIIIISSSSSIIIIIMRLERSLVILYSPPFTGRVSLANPSVRYFAKPIQFWGHARIDFDVLVLVMNV